MPSPQKQKIPNNTSQKISLSKNPAFLMCLLTIFLLIPFITKPFHIDDTLFVRLAEQIEKDPFAPYQFEYTWFLRPMPFWQVTQNPPLNSYILAIPGSLFGMNEIVFHFVGILMAAGCCLLMYRIASRLTSHAALATALTIACPGFFVSATNIMADIPLLLFWLFSIESTLAATEVNQAKKLWLAGLGICAATMTKYFGLALLPLLVVYWFIKTGKITIHLLAFLLPIFVISAWALYSIAYGNINHPFGAARYSIKGKSFEDLVENIGQTFAFLGGSLLWPLLAIPLFFKQSKLVNTLSLIIGVVTVFLGAEVWGINTGIHFGLMIFAGLGILSLAIKFTVKQFNAENVLLALWIVGTIVFSAFLNWTVNSRSLIIAFFPLAIIFIRMMESQNGIKNNKLIYAVSLITLIISLFIAWGDQQFATASKNFAQSYIRKKIEEGKTVHFGGHWGFQYYMEQEGARALNYADLSFKDGDLVVYPNQNTNSKLIQMPGYRVDVKSYPTSFVGPFTLHRQIHAGFYSSIWGPVPYMFQTRGDYDQFLIDEFDEKSKTMLHKRF